MKNLCSSYCFRSDLAFFRDAVIKSVVKRNDDEWMVVQLGSLSETEIIMKEFVTRKHVGKAIVTNRKLTKFKKCQMEIK